MKLQDLALIFLFAMAAVSGCRYSSSPVSAEPADSEYQVLSAYLSGELKPDTDRNQFNFVIASETIGLRDDPLGTTEMYKLAPALKATYQEVFRASLDASEHPGRFRSSFVLPVHYVIVEASDLKSLGAQNFWGAFYKKYPHSSGLVELSRVGFSRDGTQAGFYASGRCGGRCGSGSLVIMQKDSNSSWKIVQEVQIWVL